MNCIPRTAAETGSYMCTWGRQAYVSAKYSIPGEYGAGARDALCPQYLFGNEEDYHFLPREYREGLYFLLDDGWDVPPHTENRGDAVRKFFGAVEPDPVRFGSLGDTPTERLAALNRMAREWGYIGLGLWISPQIPMDDGSVSDEEAREYWKERAIRCRDAGVRYWKVDWGRHDGDMAYRRMMTEVVKTYAPDVAIEHACVQMPLSALGDGEKRRSLSREMLAVSDYFRTYDIMWPMEDSTTLARVHELLTDPLPFVPGVRGMLNMESQAFAAVGLGGTLGVMHPGIEVRAALRWQRLAPPFGVAEAAYRYSEEMLTDEYLYPKDPLTWVHVGGQRIAETMPAVMARGCALPEVRPVGAERPIVAASRHPQTGAYAIAALRRNIHPNVQVIAPAHVTWHLEDPEAFVGIFGYMESLTLVYPRELPVGCRVYAQNLMDDEAVEITGSVRTEGCRLTVASDVMQRVGACNYAYPDMRGRNMTDPMLLIRVEMPE